MAKTIKTTFTVNIEIMKLLREQAEREHRPISNLLHLILQEHFHPKKK